MKTGVLIIHGFAGNTGEVEPLKVYLEEKGYIVKVPELKGHTNKLQDLWRVTYKDWIMSAETELDELLKVNENVVIIGFSMGGLIATQLSVKYNPIAICTLSTPIYHWDIKRIIINVWQDINHFQNKSIRRYYRSLKIPLRALINFKILLRKTKIVLKKVRCPVFVAQGLLDDTVQSRSAEFIFNNLSADFKEKKYYKNSGHLICLGSDNEELFEDIDEFICKVFKERRDSHANT